MFIVCLSDDGNGDGAVKELANLRSFRPSITNFEIVLSLNVPIVKYPAFIWRLVGPETYEQSSEHQIF
jgi:hypothetical protein